MTPPVFRHGDLRLYLLKLLDERPMHGYDVITGLEERFGGTYTPSAGTVYPRLAKLKEEGLVSKTPDGRKTVYAITDAGRDELARRSEDLDGIESDIGDSVRRLADEVRASVEDAMRSLRADLAAAARDERSEADRRAADADARRDERDGDRARQREHVAEIDSALASFRADVRADVRAAAAAGTLPRAAVDALVDGLSDLRREVVRTLRG
ncbi:MAG: helix-turn-helix transcriptional regulator [Actinomycetales bacterium]|nr:helix-turn-helix transcriptional regulator [Actinomycetales bacterium]